MFRCGLLGRGSMLLYKEAPQDTRSSISDVEKYDEEENACPTVPLAVTSLER